MIGTGDQLTRRRGLQPSQGHPKDGLATALCDVVPYIETPVAGIHAQLNVEVALLHRFLNAYRVPCETARDPPNAHFGAAFEWDSIVRTAEIYVRTESLRQGGTLALVSRLPPPTHGLRLFCAVTDSRIALLGFTDLELLIEDVEGFRRTATDHSCPLLVSSRSLRVVRYASRLPLRGALICISPTLMREITQEWPSFFPNGVRVGPWNDLP